MKYCPYCGFGLQDTVAFCPKCGKRFRDAVENTEADMFEPEVTENTVLSSENEDEQPPYDENFSVSNTTTVDIEPNKAKAGKQVLIAAVLMLLCLFGVVAFLMVHNFSKKEADFSKLSESVLYLEVYDDCDDLTATASGFVIEDGTVLITNYHVIDGAYHIIARTSDGSRSADVDTVLAYDETADLAVLQCNSDIGVEPLILGDSDTAKQGDKVYAVGYPLGVANTLSDGVISSRYLDENGVDTLQITAAISSGSSGGALFNAKGEVIGVTSASYTDGQNLNLAISSNVITSVLRAENETVTMADLLMPQFGTNAINLLRGCYVGKINDYYFYTNISDNLCCYGSEISCSSPIIHGSSVNIWHDKIYYYDITEKEIISSTFDAKNQEIIELTPNVFQKMTLLDFMLVAYGKLYFTASDVYNHVTNFYVYDIESRKQIHCIEDVNAAFTYQNNSVYVALVDGEIAEINMLTCETRLIKTSCPAWIKGISNSGNVYYVNADSSAFSENIDNDIYFVNTSTGQETRIHKYAEDYGNNIFIVGNTLYIGMSDGWTHRTYKEVGDNKIELFNNSIDMSSSLWSYLPELNYFYSSDGTTIDMATGETLGKWIFEKQ